MCRVASFHLLRTLHGDIVAYLQLCSEPVVARATNT